MSTTQILFGFNGRINRSTWWLWSILAGIAIAVVVLVPVFVIAGIAVAIEDPPSDDATGAQVLGILVAALVIAAVSLGSLWISLALGVKRLHDQDKSGWFLLLYLVPFGNLVMLVFLGFLPGTPGPNRYGPPQGAPPGSYAAPYPYATAASTGGAYINPGYAPAPPRQPVHRPAAPTHPPNVPFEQDGEWRSYDTAGRLLRWDEGAQTWVPLPPR